MLILLSIIILSILYFDAYFFKSYNAELFNKVFKLTYASIIGVALFFFLLTFFIENFEILPVFVWIFFLPFYVLKRDEFLRLLEKDFKQEGRTLNEKFIFRSDCSGLFLKWFLSVAIFTIFIRNVGFLIEPFDSELGQMVIIGTFSSAVLVMLIYRAAVKFPGHGFWKNVGMIKVQKAFIKVYVLPSLAGLFFAVLSSYILLNRINQPHTPFNDILSEGAHPLVYLSFIILAIIISPFIEEIIFRGYLYQLMKLLRGERFAFYFVALLFGLLHVPQYWGDWIAISIVIMLGFVLTIFRAVTKTTISSVVMHYVYNIGMVIIPIIMIIVSNPPYFKFTTYYNSYDSPMKEKLLKESIDLKPSFSAAYNDLALLYYHDNKDLEHALVLADKAISIDSDIPDYYDTKIKILFKLKRYTEAIELRQNVLKKFPNWPWEDLSAKNNSAYN